MPQRIKRKLIRGCMAGIVVLSALLTPVTAKADTTSTPSTTKTVTSNVSRIGGVDQYQTAALIAEKGWTGTADNIVLSSGISKALVDALSAGPLAAQLKAPILLTDNGQTLNSFTKIELQRLKPKKIYITSGTAVIKPSVIEEIKELGITPVLLGGNDQYETSANIAKEMIAQGAKVTKVIVAAGWMAPADALSVSSIAAAQGIPILATTRDTLPPSIKDVMSNLQGVTDSYVIGGTAVVGNSIMGGLPGTVHRFSGETKFDTNLEVLKGFAGDLHFDKVYIANGDTFVDALAGVSLASLSDSPILLSQKEWPAPMQEFLIQNHLQNIVALGGTFVVPDGVLASLSTVSGGGKSSSPSSGNAPAQTPVSTGGVGGVAASVPSVPSAPSTPTSPTNPSKVTVGNLRVNTNPANFLGPFKNGTTIDLSGLDDSVKVLGFSLTADQDCTLQFKLLDKTQNIPLTANVQKDVTVGDLITGGQIQTEVNLGEFRAVYTTKTLTGQLLKDGVSAGTLTVTLKFK
ncbi:cell wall-binding protein [Desulfosporosinus acidiphilus SJ4]|uniref:Cell wall-binding protein n=1 Tax=Desulfosporosinus acidiphilus (strain DSM 22704 / JCM 16185 / SJ4) TaxID=646529 RepID=I4DBH0_DESAJ|nr:cell wall-binding repeat-containing protein [Desulfosporosinus acidiphilus]AFM43144.1 cell wall-binding protein [Desulfosporosinus acidiphilus SJ4]